MQHAPTQTDSQSLHKAIKALSDFLIKRNLFEQFKNEQHQEQILHIILADTTLHAPHNKQTSNQNQLVQVQSEIIQTKQTQACQQTAPLISRQERWIEPVQVYQQLQKVRPGQYYLFEGCYYKLKGSKITRFKSTFRLDMINTSNSKRDQVLLTKKKTLNWVSTIKLELLSTQPQKDAQGLRNEFYVQVGAQRVTVKNPVHQAMIRKFWQKVDFYGIVPTDRERNPLPELIFIQFKQ